MKHLFTYFALVALLLVLSNASLFAADLQPVGNLFDQSPGDWEFVADQSDEFNDVQVDAQKWNINTEDWGTWSWEPENIFQKDGSLHLQMVQDDHQRGNTKLAYTSGIARQYSTAVYGYFEARVKGCDLFPGASPAFWLHSKGPENRYEARDGETVAYSEIDIIELQQSEYNKETKQHNGADIIDCNLHAVLIRNGQRQWIRPGTHPETNKNEYHAPFDPREDFHVYGVENSKDFVVWYIDGKEVARKPNLYWHLPMHVTLSLGLRHPFEAYKNGQRVAVLEKTTQEGFPTEMLVDYVRVWRNNDVVAEAPAVKKQSQGSGTKTRPNMVNKAGGKATGNGMSQDQFVAMEKAKWEKNGWPWNQEKVESNFAEMDADNDGVASGIERQQWFAKKQASLK
ncbi:Glycosyl hydrolases family 16 [Neorhodopirellula lusitana]|uniref:Glycosyl hydrolases family 16 n=1 Tax=Neorhodopirellula lusitana TaxID=445327 RepID=A0ABY1PQP1_9BACT|nr:kappa-carrageenase [Neorhodopirellula lusitana]SMP41401.1 Glycosyl hydrolases family 16 [Neorhodopirellula lusitana]